ncbi:MAG: hypothetical protein CMO55_11775 [Verrucomicrobiales bacterium]|nr:hypothetical protein [Verrucomicrobiales bacterium]
MRWYSILFVIVLSTFLTGCFEKRAAVVVPQIEDAPKYLAKRHLQITGTPHLDMMGVHTWRSGSVGAGKSPSANPKQWRYVVPLTGKGWDKSQPIPCWVSFSTNKEHVSAEAAALRRDLSGGSIVGINVDFPSRTVGALRGKSAWQSAIEDAEARYGIRADPRAPILSWKPGR